MYIYQLYFTILYDAMLYYFQKECHSLIQLCRNNLNIFSHAEKVKSALPASATAPSAGGIWPLLLFTGEVRLIWRARAALVLGNLVL